MVANAKLQAEIEAAKRIQDIVHEDDSSSDYTSSSESDDDSPRAAKFVENLIPVLGGFNYSKHDIVKLAKKHDYNEDAIQNAVLNIMDSGPVDDGWNQVLSKADKKAQREAAEEEERREIREAARKERQQKREEARREAREKLEKEKAEKEEKKKAQKAARNAPFQDPAVVEVAGKDGKKKEESDKKNDWNDWNDWYKKNDWNNSKSYNEEKEESGVQKKPEITALPNGETANRDFQSPMVDKIFTAAEEHDKAKYENVFSKFSRDAPKGGRGDKGDKNNNKGG